MRLTVLGSGAACPPAGGVCSGYLLEDRGCRVLLDCGHGVAPALLQCRPDADLDHIIISHMHADHFIDVIPLRFRLTRDMSGLDAPRVRLHLPPGGIATFAEVLAAVCFPPDFLSSVFIIDEYAPGAEIPLGNGLTARFAEGIHYIPGYAVRIDGSRSLVYTGDTAPSDNIGALAQGADLMLSEATLDEPEEGPVRGHLTARQAADLAAAADVQRLILTHFWFDTDREAVCKEAQARFAGTVAAAYDGMQLDLQGASRP